MTRQRHLIWNESPSSTTECYDRSRDPTEARDIWDPSGDGECVRLARELKRLVAGLGFPPAAAQQLSANVTLPGGTAPVPSHPAKVWVGDLALVRGYDLTADAVRPGGSIDAVIYWAPARRMPRDMRLVYRLRGPGWSHDLPHVPVSGLMPLGHWRPGQQLRESDLAPPADDGRTVGRRGRLHSRRAVDGRRRGPGAGGSPSGDGDAVMDRVGSRLSGRVALGATAGVAALAILETLVALVAPWRAPTDADWSAVEAAVRQGFRPGNLIVAAPAWADPILRVHLGDLIPPATAARMDDARYPRLWEISQRGARSPEGTRGDVRADSTFGRLRVRLIERPAADVTYDFVAHTPDARVVVQPGGAATTGLERKIVEVDQRLRWAIMTEPVAGRTVAIEFPAVPLGRELAIATGLHDTWMRKAARGTVQAQLVIGERRVALPDTTNDSGWTETHVDTSAELGRTAPVRVEISSAAPLDRFFAFAAEARR